MLTSNYECNINIYECNIADFAIYIFKCNVNENLFTIMIATKNVQL